MITALIFSAITVAPHFSVPHFSVPHITPAPVRVAPVPAKIVPARAPESVKVAPIIAPAPHIASKCDEKKEKCK